MTDSFFEQLDENVFGSNQSTAGPWAADAQHGGPPAALLGRAIQRAGGRDDVHVSRITYEILRPVPVAQLRIETETIRPGKNVELLRAALLHRSEKVMTATAWRIRTSELPLDPPPSEPPSPGPDDVDPVAPFETNWSGYLQAMEWRFDSGGFTHPGSAAAWIRMRIPLLPDEPVSPLTRVLIAADSGSGISAILDWKDWLFINPDLTVGLHRLPEGEWVRLEARSTIEAHGVGQAATEIFDTSGSIGRGLQSLYVTQRR